MFKFSAQLVLLCCGRGHQVGGKPRHQDLLQLCPDQEDGFIAVRGAEVEEGHKDPQAFHRSRWPDHNQEGCRGQEGEAVLRWEHEGLQSPHLHHLRGARHAGAGAGLSLPASFRIFIFMPIHKPAAALFGGSLRWDVLISTECK